MSSVFLLYDTAEQMAEVQLALRDYFSRPLTLKPLRTQPAPARSTSSAPLPEAEATAAPASSSKFIRADEPVPVKKMPPWPAGAKPSSMPKPTSSVGAGVVLLPPRPTTEVRATTEVPATEVRATMEVLATEVRATTEVPATTEVRATTEVPATTEVRATEVRATTEVPATTTVRATEVPTEVRATALHAHLAPTCPKTGTPMSHAGPCPMSHAGPFPVLHPQPIAMPFGYGPMPYGCGPVVVGEGPGPFVFYPQPEGLPARVHAPPMPNFGPPSTNVPLPTVLLPARGARSKSASLPMQARLFGLLGAVPPAKWLGPDVSLEQRLAFAPWCMFL